MQISSNYQICSRIRYFNSPLNQNKLQNFAHNNGFENKNYNCNMPITQNVAFKASVNPPVAVKNILNKSIVFGPKEYKNLSNKYLGILREYGKSFKESDSKIINFILNFGKLFSNRIHEKYPNGFVFVSVGRSPAFLGKYLEFQGEDVKYCPISNIRSYTEFSPYFVQEYKKYLDNVGLTKDFAQNTKKPIIITDYSYYGGTLGNFSDLLAKPQIGINEGEKVKYSPITRSFGRFLNNIFECFPHENNHYFNEAYGFSDKLYIDMMSNDKTKKYTSIPRLNPSNFKPGRYEDVLNKYYQNGNRFEEDFDTKMMNFLIADSIHSSSKI